MKTRQEQIEEMLHDLLQLRLTAPPIIDRIMPVIYWLEVELKEEKEKLGVDKTN